MKNLLNLRGRSSTMDPVQPRPASGKQDTGVTLSDPGPLPDPLARELLQPVTPLHSVAVVRSQTGGRSVETASIAELEQLDADDAVMAFRVFQSFGYSASLLFHRAELAYYVALYQHGQLWQVLKPADLDTAEATFRYFEEQATRLSEGEMRAAHLEAQNEQLARQIAHAETQSERLRIDLDNHAAQTQTVTQRQQQMRRETALLDAQRVAAQALLNRLRRQIHQLGLTDSERIPHLPGR
ncbi:hypothetical protein P3T23_009309 [Paraburkholderia sp. GAS448]|uniref:DUF2968 domain-containing protein n=1 Tax=Paraburkholderia sp. GAS448 TaxID=3035136 RepID=UPI003D221058